MAAVPLGLTLVVVAERSVELVAASLFAASVAGMFGLSALYHCFDWPRAALRWLRRLDHVGVYGLIAGTYTAFGLLALEGRWRWILLGIVWSGAFVAALLKFVWLDAPKWLSAATGIALGWVGVVVAPQLFAEIGVGGALLVLAGGVAYTVGALVYALRRPDPYPAVFGFHEVFHVLVIAAVACQFSALAFFALGE